MTAPTDAELDNRFSYHAPDEAAKELHGGARSMALNFAAWITDFVPPGREQSLALTKLEEAMFWCNAAIARIDSEGNRR